jgi:hypothetical protein
MQAPEKTICRALQTLPEVRHKEAIPAWLNAYAAQQAESPAVPS